MDMTMDFSQMSPLNHKEIDDSCFDLLRNLTPNSSKNGIDFGV